MVSDQQGADVKKTILAALLTLPLVAAAQFPCLPSQVGGKGTRAFFEEDAVAKAYGWWCPDPWVAPQLVLVSGPNSAFTPDWKQIGLELLTKPEPDRVAAFAKYVTVSYPVVNGQLLVPADVYPIHKKVWDQLQPLKPPTYKWVVAPNGTLFTRPTYSYTGGVRGKVSNGTVNVGTACNCIVRFIERSQAYCSVNDNLNQVAVCRKG